MSFAFLVAGFLATTNAGRVALAGRRDSRAPRSMALALLLGFGLVALAAVTADELLDALDISPESFRIAAGVVLAAMGLRTILWPDPAPGPFAAVLVTPELTCLAISFGADEPVLKVLGAAAVAMLFVAAVARRLGLTSPVPAQFLAALQLVISVALVVSGVRDV